MSSSPTIQQMLLSSWSIGYWLHHTTASGWPCIGSGQAISELLPWQQKLAEDICVIRSMVTDQINHDPAHTFMNCGTAISGRPSMGTWINYGLGSECDELPGFVVLTSIGGREPDQPIASRQWSSGFLPSRFQGVEFNSIGEPVHYVRNPPGIPDALQRASVRAIQQLDEHHNQLLADPEIEARVSAYETAYRMQTSVPELIDLSDEPDHVLRLYSSTPGDGSFASNCLLARRLAEKGVRFIHLYHRGWDHHASSNATSSAVPSAPIEERTRLSPTSSIAEC